MLGLVVAGGLYWEDAMRTNKIWLSWLFQIGIADPEQTHRNNKIACLGLFCLREGKFTLDTLSTVGAGALAGRTAAWKGDDKKTRGSFWSEQGWLSGMDRTLWRCARNAVSVSTLSTSDGASRRR